MSWSFDWWRRMNGEVKNNRRIIGIWSGFSGVLGDVIGGWQASNRIFALDPIGRKYCQTVELQPRRIIFLAALKSSDCEKVYS